METFSRAGHACDCLAHLSPVSPRQCTAQVSKHEFSQPYERGTHVTMPLATPRWVLVLVVVLCVLSSPFLSPRLLLDVAAVQSNSLYAFLILPFSRFIFFSSLSPIHHWSSLDALVMRRRSANIGQLPRRCR